MQFYIYQGSNGDESWPAKGDRAAMQERVCTIAQKSAAFHRTLREDVCFFVSGVSEDEITVGVICAEQIPLQKRLDAYLNAVGLQILNAEPEEVTFGTLLDLLRGAERRDYIGDYREILEHFDLEDLRMRNLDCIECSESLIEARCPEFIYAAAENHFLNEMLRPELDRIYAGKQITRHVGHPVHYLLQTDDDDSRKYGYRLLLAALYDRGRLQNRRYNYVDLRPGNELSTTFYDCMYRSTFGGAVVVRFRPDSAAESDYANPSRAVIEFLCKAAEKYRHQVLTVFCLPLECKKTKELFYDNLCGVSLVELKEEHISGERVFTYLKTLARYSALRTDKKLFADLEQEQTYRVSELHARFERWHDEKLKTVTFPQYKKIQTVKKEVAKAEPKGSAYDELCEMIGLAEAKQTICKAIDYHKAQKLFADQGMQTGRPSMHMVFTGNPGTAKTTVARLFARIMKENSLLSRGQIVEVGRGDLVGKYVGWTAPTIQKKFRQAQGGVLFIDEAYSLVDDRDGSYGDEAINTIVQEMETHRDDVVVIFAGYPDKMEGFLNKNPGLRSRIAFHVKFEDYNADELCEIAELFAKQQSLRLTAEAESKLHALFEAARKEKDFGNGRYVRNVLEHARMAQASRLLAGDVDHLGKDAIATICAEDVTTPPVLKQQRPQIGFC